MPASRSVVAFLGLLAASPAASEALVLSDQQLDAVTAGALITVLGGEAVAVGQDTLAAGNLDLTVLDKKNLTVAKGEVAMVAAASPSGDDAAYVAADTFAYAEGADVVFIKMNTVTNKDQTVSISVTEIKAIDLKGYDFRAPLVVTHTVSKTKKGPALVSSGNVATLDFSASAVAKDTLVDVQAEVLALQGELSQASINVIAAGG